MKTKWLRLNYVVRNCTTIVLLSGLFVQSTITFSQSQRRGSGIAPLSTTTKFKVKLHRETLSSRLRALRGYPEPSAQQLNELRQAVSNKYGSSVQMWEESRHEAGSAIAIKPVKIPQKTSHLPTASTQGSLSDSVQLVWEDHNIRSYADVHSDDFAKAVVTDRNQNVYITGQSDSTGSSIDFVTIKYDANGNHLWTRRYTSDCHSADSPAAIAIDSTGNIYVTGVSLCPQTGFDIVTIKYHPDGSQEWIQRFDGADHDDDVVSGIAIDKSGNIYIAGATYNLNDFYDYLVIKYSPDGTEQWERTYNGTLSYDDGVYGLTLDDNGNVFVTGLSNAVVGGANITTISYDPAGSMRWKSEYDGTTHNVDLANAITNDISGNIYVTGLSVDSLSSQGLTVEHYISIKYDNTGDTLWTARYSSGPHGDDVAKTIGVDQSGNVYVCGENNISPFTLTSVKYNSAGVQQWASVTDTAFQLNGMSVDAAGNSYITGQSNDGFDLTGKYDPSGNQKWLNVHSKYQSGMGNAITIDNNGQIVITGNTTTDSTLDDYLTVKYTPGGSQRWLKTFDTTGAVFSWFYNAVVDPRGFVYVFLHDDKSRLIKYSSSGEQLWVRAIDTVYPEILTLAPDGNLLLSVAGKVNHIMKFSEDGTLLWNYPCTGNEFLSTYGGGNEQAAGGIKIGPGGDVYVAGVGSTTPPWNTAWKILRLSSDGVLKWFFTLDSTGINDSIHIFLETPQDIAVDNTGNAYVTGESPLLTSYPPSNMIIKLFPNGSLAWAHRTMVSGFVRLDDSDNVYVVSITDGTIEKYSNDGVLQWRNGSANLPLFKVALDHSGHIYLVGESYTIRQYSVNGIFQWMYSIPGPGAGAAQDLAFDRCNNVYVTGANSGVQTMKFHPDGTEAWQINYSGWGWGVASSSMQLGVDNQSNVYVNSMLYYGYGYFTNATSTLMYQQTLKLAAVEDSLDFGTIDIGSSKTDTMHLQSTICTSPSTVKTTLSDTNFAIHVLGDTSAPASVISYALSFIPRTPGTFRSMLSFSQPNDPTTIVIPVHGTAVYRKPVYSLSVIGFDTTNVGCWQTKSLTIRNPLGSALQIQSVSTGDSNFTGQCPQLVIAPGDSTVISVRFAPMTSGVKSAHLFITHNYAPGPDTIQLMGVATGTGQEIVIHTALGTDWQLISIPVWMACPWTLSNAFIFNNGYAQLSVASPGLGFWQKMVDSESYYGGLPIMQETLQVKQNWNIVGPPSYPIPATTISTNPPGIIQTPFFNYSSLSGYHITDTLYPGIGYWVRVSQNGTLLMQSNPEAIIQQKTALTVPKIQPLLTLIDHEGRSGTLYCFDGPVDESIAMRYMMPPLPPQGLPDVRFANGRMAASSTRVDLPITISGYSFPIQIRWDLQNHPSNSILTIGGRQVHLIGTGSASIPGANTPVVLKYRSDPIVPTSYALDQNYPNPFNPSTTINYQLPHPSRIHIGVWNINGQLVKTLVEAEQEAGYQSVTWSGTDGHGDQVASGIYFVRLSVINGKTEAPVFQQTIKMALIR